MKYSFIKYLNEQFTTLADVVKSDDCADCDTSLKNSAKKRGKFKKKYHYENLLKYIQQHNVAQ